jgi:hypothetical protein
VRTRARSLRAHEIPPDRSRVGAADKGSTHRVEGTGKISVDVKAPRGTKVAASGGGIFKKTEVERTPQMQEEKEGPAAIQE